MGGRQQDLGKEGQERASGAACAFLRETGSLHVRRSEATRQARQTNQKKAQTSGVCSFLGFPTAKLLNEFIRGNLPRLGGRVLLRPGSPSGAPRTTEQWLRGGGGLKLGSRSAPPPAPCRLTSPSASAEWEEAGDGFVLGPSLKRPPHLGISGRVFGLPSAAGGPAEWGARPGPPSLA